MDLGGLSSPNHQVESLSFQPPLLYELMPGDEGFASVLNSETVGHLGLRI